MSEFVTLLGKIAPLYLIISVGFFAGKKLQIESRQIATVLIYIVAPVVVFNGVATAPRNAGYFFLPVIFLSVGSFLAVCFYFIGGLFYKTSERNLLGFISGTGNTGYFGLPLVLALFGPRAQSVAVLSTLGLILFENSVGYFFIAKSDASAKAAAKKILHLPAIYAFALGAAIFAGNWTFPATITETISYFRGAYVVLGMMVIGLGLSSVTKGSFDAKFTSIAMVSKFVAFPLAIAGVIYIDKAYFDAFSAQTHLTMMILAITPLASNTVAFATTLKAHPEKAAVSVMISTVFALVYIPVFIAIFLK